MKRRAPAVACLILAALAVSCTVYRIKEMDAKTLSAKGGKAAILSVQTKTESIKFLENDPGRLKGDGVVGNVHGELDIDPYDIAELVPARKRAKVVLKEGTRVEVLSSRPSGDLLKCEVVRPTWIPLDDVVLATVRTVNTAASVLSTLGGAVLFVGALALAGSSDEEGDFADETGDDLVVSLIDSVVDPGGAPNPRRSVKALLGMDKSSNAAAEAEFWIMEWTPVSAAPDEDGKCRVRLENASGAPRGVDEAKLVVVDHPPGVGVAPDSRGVLGTFSNPVPPARASDGEGRDITPLVFAKDDVFWRSPGGDSAVAAKSDARDALTFEFHRPSGARWAKLIVNATNSAWRAQFAREVLASSGQGAPDQKKPPVYQEAEYAKLRVRILTVFGWQTGQVVFAGGPLPGADMIYNIDLDDVSGETVRLKLEPPARYWLIDRLALDYSENVPIERTEADVEGVDSPDAAEVVRALAVEDGSTLFLESPGAQSMLTFTVPPPKEGMERTLFLRTVSCYEMPPRAIAPPGRPGSPGRQRAADHP